MKTKPKLLLSPARPRVCHVSGEPCRAGSFPLPSPYLPLPSLRRMIMTSETHLYPPTQRCQSQDILLQPVFGTGEIFLPQTSQILCLFILCAHCRGSLLLWASQAVHVLGFSCPHFFEQLVPLPGTVTVTFLSPCEWQKHASIILLQHSKSLCKSFFCFLCLTFASFASPYSGTIFSLPLPC